MAIGVMFNSIFKKTFCRKSYNARIQSYYKVLLIWMCLKTIKFSLMYLKLLLWRSSCSWLKRYSQPRRYWQRHVGDAARAAQSSYESRFGASLYCAVKCKAVHRSKVVVDAPAAHVLCLIIKEFTCCLFTRSYLKSGLLNVSLYPKYMGSHFLPPVTHVLGKIVRHFGTLE